MIGKSIEKDQRVKKWFDTAQKVFNGTVLEVEDCKEHSHCGNKFATVRWDDGVEETYEVSELEPIQNERIPSPLQVQCLRPSKTR